MAHKALMVSVAAAAVAVSAGTAFAGGFALREQSAYSQGASFAGAAAPGDSISAMFWNPAAVTTAEGLVTESHATFILPYSEIDVTGSALPYGPGSPYGNGGDLGIDAFVPSSYVAYQVNDSLYLGVSINAPYGLATHAQGPWVGQTDHLHAKVFSTNVAPTIGYKVNEQLSVALGVQLQYFKVALKRAAGVQLDPPTATLEGDSFGFGFTAGVTYEPFDGTTIGLGFRSAFSNTLDGDITVSSGLGSSSNAIEADITLPEMVSLGIRQRVTDQFTLLGSVEWTNWSRLGTVPVTLQANGATATELEFEYEDGWFFGVGGEYAWNEDLTVRAGVSYEVSPVQDEYRTARLPDANRIWASIGASYDFNDRLSFDAAYTHIFVDDAPINVTTGAPYSGTAEGDVDILAVSLRYKLGG
jgi:long-chain fatty acid transport protein